ncbi:hypothetical protein SUGI_0970500 [Cryptomeria japonica]|uniref:uncharacterized protein LOC131033843 n=1 Tax=Cryptomeria japonica TaxID=3369 RepID=UPI0024146AFA|nr:uncharacterized protein LOC131033843 [Cryptomeria japonica]GLJ46067.1 hypothetical protein SUGI_0970500 [Cryptomeria japonica]
MVSLRNEVRKKRRAAENKLVQVSQGFLQPIEKINYTEHPRSNISVRVSNDTDGNGLAVKIEETRVCTEGNAGFCSDESARVCTDEGSRICTDEDNGVCTNENSRFCANGSSRVSASENGAAQLLTPKEEKEEEFRVSIERDDSAFEGLTKKAKMQSPRSGEDEDEDNVPIIKSLMRSKKDEDDDNTPISRSLIRDKKDEDEDNVPISRMLTRNRKGDVLKNQQPCLENHGYGEIPLENLSPVNYNLPGRGKDVLVEQQDNGQKIKRVIRRSDNNNIDDSSQKNVLSGGKDVKVLQQDKSRKKNKPILRSDNNSSNIAASQGDVPAGVEDEKTDKEYKIQKGMKPIRQSDNGNSDVPSQVDAAARAKDVEVEKKDKVWEKNQPNLLIDDDNFDVPLQSMMRSRNKDAKMERKNKGHKKNLNVSINDNDDGSIPSNNATPVEDVLAHGGKDVMVGNLDEGLVKKQIVLENDKNNGDIISQNDSTAKETVFGGGKNAKIEEKDKGCDLRRASKFQEGDMVWAKVKSHPWWPGQVYNPIFAAPKARKLKPDHILIAFFGDSSYGWFLESDLVPFEQNYVEKSKQSTQRGFTKAVEEAVDEISRRAALGLMCVCRNGDAFRPRKQEGYVNVDVQGYVNPGLYSFRQIKVAKNAFKPADMLSFVRNLAVLPGSGEVKCISGIKSVAEVLAYRVATFVSINEDYQSALRITESTAYFGADAQDQCESESVVGYTDVTAETAPVDEKKEISMHVKVKDLARRSILLGKSSDMEDSYFLKRREGIHSRRSSTGDDFLYVMQNSQANSESKDEGDDSDCIGRYLFKKRMQNEEAKPAERKTERKDKKRNFLRELDDYKEERARKKEVVRKAFHMKPLDREKESIKSIFSMELCETEEFTKGDIPEAQVRKDFYVRSINEGEETQMSTVSKKTGQVQELNDLCNPDVGMSNVSPISGNNQVSNDLRCINDLVGSHDAQVECELKPIKFCHQKNDKKPVENKNNFISNISSGSLVEEKCTGSDKSLEGEHQMGPTILCDEIDHRENILEGAPISSVKEPSDQLKFQDTDSRDALREQQVVQASLMDLHKESFIENELEHGNEVLIAAIRTPKLEPAALESSSSAEFHSRKVFQSVDLSACNTLPTSKGQTENKTENALDNAGSSEFDGILSVNPIKPIILKSEGSDNSFDKSGAKVENIKLHTEAGKTSNQLSASLADASMDLTDAGHNFTSSLALGNLDHAAIKKTKGFKRLVKFAKSSASKETRNRKVKPIKRISNNDTHLFDDLEPPEKQCKVSETIERKSEVLKDLTSAIDPDKSTALDYGMATSADGNQIVSAVSPDQSEDNKITCKEVCSEESRFCILEIMNDLLSLALNPFYGIERDCPSKVSLVFLKFRSLVYQKSLTSISSSAASKNLPSLHEIESDLETKKISGLKESNIKHHNVEDGVDNGNADLESNEIVPQTSAKMEHSASPVLKTGKNQTPDANANKKRKLEIKSDGLSLRKRLKKLKDLDSAPSKKSNLTSIVLKSSGVLKENESVQQPKVSKKSYFDRPSSSSKSLEVPMALCMKFPRGFALPSEVQLKVRFARFGPLDVSGTRIYCKSGSAQVVFKHSSDAETAYKYATENNLFGQADVNFWLKQNLQPKKETSVLQFATELTRLPRVRNDEVPSLMAAVGQEDFSSSRSLDKYGTAEAVVEGTPKLALQLQPVVQLKSCLKRPDEYAVDSGKETNRVTFLLGREEPNLAPETYTEEPFQIENVCLPSSTFLPVESNGIVNPPIEIKAMESDLPNISHQMLYLLMKCNDIVTDIGRSLGYMPYCPL